MWFFLLACTDKDDSGESALEEPWHLALTGEGDAMLLSAWSSGDTLLMVGGGLGEDAHGDLVQVRDGSLCVQHAVTEHALWWIHGDDDGTWMVGEQGTVLKGDGTRVDIDTTHTLYGVYVDGPDLWVVGGDVTTGEGAIWRGDGTDWELVQETEGVMFKDWDGLFVGDGHTCTLDGSTMTQVGTNHRLVTVRETTAVGGSASSLIVEWDGSDWTEQDTLYLNGPLNGLYEHDGVLYVGGNAGTMGYNAGDGWQIPDFPLTSDTFHAVWEHDGVIWFIGGNFFSAGDNHMTLATYGEVDLEVTDCAR